MARRTPDERRATALHEAGHAVAYLLVGRRFRYATIRAERGVSLGHVDFTVTSSLRPWMAAEKGLVDVAEVICYLAGAVAGGDIISPDDLGGAYGDLESCSQLLIKAGCDESTMPALCSAATGVAIELIIQHKTGFAEIVARLLTGRKKVSWKEARKIFETAHPDCAERRGKLRRALRPRRPEAALKALQVARAALAADAAKGGA